jgi:hypothetical protein
MKPKIPTQKIKSDDCAVNIGQVIEEGSVTDPGTPHYVHKGEWVEIMPVMTVKEVTELSNLQVASDNPGSLGQSMTRLCHELSKRIISWNWTDMMGEDLDQPYKNPTVLEELTSDELMWLINATSGGESTEDRKKDSAPLESTS